MGTTSYSRQYMRIHRAIIPSFVTLPLLMLLMTPDLTLRHNSASFLGVGSTPRFRLLASESRGDAASADLK